MRRKRKLMRKRKLSRKRKVEEEKKSVHCAGRGLKSKSQTKKVRDGILRRKGKF